MEATLIMAGDNLIHSNIIDAGRDNKTDWTFMYENISQYLSNHDIRILNQETPFIEDSSLWSGYPRFGTPSGVGYSAFYAGFNVFANATNHAADKGASGVEDTCYVWENCHASYVGIRLTPDDDTNLYVDVNGITIAIVNYTYGLNGNYLGSDNTWMVNVLGDKEVIAQKLQEAEENADATVAILHWGDEYTYEPNSYQKEWAQFFIDNGADAIIGGHPHVVQPLEDIDGVPVFWSIGNFISGQVEYQRMLGAFAEMKFVKDDSGNTKITYAKATPIVTHIDRFTGDTEVYLLDDYNDALCEEHALHNKISMENLTNLWCGVMDDTYIPYKDVVYCTVDDLTLQVDSS